MRTVCGTRTKPPEMVCEILSKNDARKKALDVRSLQHELNINYMRITWINAIKITSRSQCKTVHCAEREQLRKLFLMTTPTK